MFHRGPVKQPHIFAILVLEKDLIQSGKHVKGGLVITANFHSRGRPKSVSIGFPRHQSTPRKSDMYNT